MEQFFFSCIERWDKALDFAILLLSYRQLLCVLVIEGFQHMPFAHRMLSTRKIFKQNDAICYSTIFCGKCYVAPNTNDSSDLFIFSSKLGTKEGLITKASTYIPFHDGKILWWQLLPLLGNQQVSASAWKDSIEYPWHFLMFGELLGHFLVTKSVIYKCMIPFLRYLKR